MSNQTLGSPDPDSRTPENSGPPLRALAMVLLSLAIVFLGLGAFSLTDSGDETAPAEAAATSTTTSSAVAAPAATPAPASTTATPTTSAAAASESVRVLNNSNVSGLAAETAQTLESAGFTVGETGNYSSGTISASTVYYDSAVSGQQAEAERIGTVLGYEVQPRFEGIESSAPGIIVIVTQ